MDRRKELQQLSLVAVALVNEVYVLPTTTTTMRLLTGHGDDLLHDVMTGFGNSLPRALVRRLSLLLCKYI